MGPNHPVVGYGALIDVYFKDNHPPGLASAEVALNFEAGFCSLSCSTLRYKIPQRLGFLSAYDDINLTVYASRLQPVEPRPAYCINIYGPTKIGYSNRYWQEAWESKALPTNTAPTGS
ncbi:uncharacterized protein PV07_12690 [Cladophialophora immunda]|uniref:Uncharacterized protein n=1 Tax=Cladophialophora immunda TaxID=569365 RepID=A0A0D2CED0_9EURO|nr:uncharacterized protein PV07_12690 [Cladophialophora immunda]KIW21899.1 hypothetical protein PV07_12690 [Cladophialophora immunda]